MQQNQLSRVVVEVALVTADTILSRGYAIKAVKTDDGVTVYHDSQRTLTDGIKAAGLYKDRNGRTATLDKNGNVGAGRFTSIGKRIKQDVEKYEFNYLEVEFIRLAIRIANDYNVSHGATQEEIKRDTILAEKLAVSFLIEERL